MPLVKVSSFASGLFHFSGDVVFCIQNAILPTTALVEGEVNMATVYARGIALNDLASLPDGTILFRAQLVHPATESRPDDSSLVEWGRRQLLDRIPPDKLPLRLSVSFDPHIKEPYLAAIVLSVPSDKLNGCFSFNWISWEARRIFDALEMAIRETGTYEYLDVLSWDGDGPVMVVSSEVFDIEIRYEEQKLVIVDLLVESHWRRRGIGGRLVRAILQVSDRYDLPVWASPAGPKGFWAKQGFEIVPSDPPCWVYMQPVPQARETLPEPA